MSNDRRYARFYYGDFIRDYPDVYGNDAALAAFLRLLSAAEMAWPATPEIPRSCRPKGLSILVGCGLVKVTGHTFVLKGFAKEREMRSHSGRNAAAVRWHSGGNADPMPKRGEEKKEEKGEQGVRPLEGRHLSAVVDP